MAPVMLVLMSYYMASIPGFSEGEPINLAEYWPLFAGGCAVMLYLGSRLSMSYPLTMMGQFDAPIKQSWIMTRAQAGRIALGFMLLVLPVSIVTMIVVLAVSYGMNMGTQALPESGTVSDFDIGFAEHLIYKTIGSTYMLFAFALVSAFYARAYAFLVRSQQGTPSA